MHQLLLEPADVLFFRDGRPMLGASIGHGAAWPLPNVVNAALHAALHRGLVEKVEKEPGRTIAKAGRTHAEALPRRNGECTYLPDDKAARHFTDFWSVGPFPVKAGRWFFPRPADAQDKTSSSVTHQPYADGDNGSTGIISASLPAPLRFSIGHTRKQSKEKVPSWFGADAMRAYVDQSNQDLVKGDFAFDSEFADTEYTVGIAIDPATQTTGQGEAEGRIYSAQYLRLVEDVRLGLLAGDATAEGDTIGKLFPSPGQMIVGGQQRVCRVNPTRLGSGQTLPLPRGITDPAKLKTMPRTGKYLIKWVLLTPAVWPEISGGKTGKGTDLNPHPGGWLPNWVFLKWNNQEGRVQKDHPDNGAVLLRVRPERSKNQHRRQWRESVQMAAPIPARLVAALVPKPIVITGWSLAGQAAAESTRAVGGAKSTHLAVPAGAVYYFEVDVADGSDPSAHARNLLAALNWHGTSQGTEIQNRRSTLLGEKGFGLGVCGTWTPITEPPPHVRSRSQT
jgi:CRISPR-associated protein Cmr3